MIAKNDEDQHYKRQEKVIFIHDKNDPLKWQSKHKIHVLLARIPK